MRAKKKTLLISKVTNEKRKENKMAKIAIKFEKANSLRYQSLRLYRDKIPFHLKRGKCVYSNDLTS